LRIAGADVRVVVGAERVADVVDQCHHDIIVVASVAMRARRGLQAVAEPVHREAAIIAVEQLQDVRGRAAPPLAAKGTKWVAIVAQSSCVPSVIAVNWARS
jgi:hypothetical protein